MLAAKVAHNFDQFHLSANGIDAANNHAIAVTRSEYQQLLLSSQGIDMAHSPFHMMPVPQQQHQQQQRRQPAIILSRHHAQAPQSLPASEMTYLGQTLIPSGYPTQRSTFQQSASFSNSPYDDRQLHAWPRSNHQQSSSSAESFAQRHYFEEYQHNRSLQAGSCSSFSSGRASMDMPSQHLQASVFNQISPTQYHSPQSDYRIGIQQQQQQHHHHHSLPPRSTSNLHSSEYGDSSSRERDQVGAHSMVGSEGMPEPAQRPKGPKLKFTRADDALLIDLKEGKNLTWKQIADFFPGRSSGTLQVRYCTKLKAKTTVWTDELVQKLRNAITEYEQDRWRVISSKVGNGFSSTACQDKALELEIEEGGESFLVGNLDEEDDYNSSTQH